MPGFTGSGTSASRDSALVGDYSNIYCSVKAVSPIKEKVFFFPRHFSSLKEGGAFSTETAIKGYDC